jgi:hypothetical protein
MKFRCNAAPNAAPCVKIATTNDRGEPLPKPKRTIKVVRNGQVINSWIDRCSRKHFTPVDDEARQLNARDYKEMFDELTDIFKPYGKSVPKGTSFAILADSLAKIEYDRSQKKTTAKPVLLTVPDLPESSEAPVELTNAELKSKITDLGGSYPTVVNKAQLKDILAKLIK